MDNKQWLRKDQPRSTIGRRIRSAKKVMYAVFFNCQGPVVQVPVPGGRTITGKFYLDKVLKRVKTFYNHCRPRTGLRGLYLIHYNASAHKCEYVKKFLDSEKVVQVCHPPFSPDLTPCDFFLFPEGKNKLFGRRFNTGARLEVSCTSVCYVYQRETTLRSLRS